MMMFQLWDDSKIIQDTPADNSSGKGRVYIEGDREYASVTNILGRFEDKEYLVKWIEREGEEQAELIRKKASSHGNSVHKELEAYFRLNYPELIVQENPELQKLAPEDALEAARLIQEKILDELHENHNELIKPFEPLFPFVRPVALEKRLTWWSDDGSIGFGGTADAFKLIDCNLLPPGIKPTIVHEGIPYVLCVLDWKNFNRRKRPLEYNRKGCSYYPLIKYALQLSAYSAAFNKRTDLRYRLNQGILACAYNTAPKGEPMQYELDIYHFNQQSLCWYWKNFQKMMEIFYTNQDPKTFRWSRFCSQAHALGFLGNEIGTFYSSAIDKSA